MPALSENSRGGAGGDHAKSAVAAAYRTHDDDDDENQGTRLTVDQWIEGDGSIGRFQCMVTAFGAFIWFATSFQWLSLTYSADWMQTDLGLSSTQSGLAGSALFAGAGVGTYLFSALGDCIGRRNSLILSTFLTCLTSFATAAIRTYAELMTFRFLNGIATGGLGTLSYCLVVEYSPWKWRATAGISLNIAWSVGAALLAAIAYLSRDYSWRYYQIWMTIPTGLLLFVLYWVPESARWLHQRERFSEAEKWLQRMSTMNGVDRKDTVLLRCDDVSSESSSTDEVDVLVDDDVVPFDSTLGGVVDRMRLSSQETEDRRLLPEAPSQTKNSMYWLCCADKTLTLYVWILMYLWLINSFLYYGLSLNSGNLKGSKYANGALAGALELPALLAAAYFVDKLGRRLAVCGFVAIAGMALVASTEVPSAMASTGLALAGKFGITASFILLYVFTTEVVPTITRGTALGLCSLSSRSASVASPIVVQLFPSSKIVVLIMGVMALVGAALVLVLRETKAESLGSAPPVSKKLKVESRR